MKIWIKKDRAHKGSSFCFPKNSRGEILKKVDRCAEFAWYLMKRNEYLQSELVMQ